MLSCHVTSCHRSLTIRVKAPGFDEFMLDSRNYMYVVRTRRQDTVAYGLSGCLL